MKVRWNQLRTNASSFFCDFFNSYESGDGVSVHISPPAFRRVAGRPTFKLSFQTERKILVR